jgi:PhzF family phenazine biosynthesis protein
MAAASLLHIDAFAERPFAGNPAAVCLLEDDRKAAWMQAVAAEMNLSETAFVRPLAEGFALRWFTPKVEVALCGHATLAAAHALWSTGRIEAAAPIRFHTQSGVLTATHASDRILLDFPATPATACNAPPPGLLEALGVDAAVIARSTFDLLLEVESPEVLRRLAPDFRRLSEVDVRGVIVTAASDDRRFDFVSRFFAPAAGIDEDPVTGSAHCCLGPYWSERLGKTRLAGYQASPRGGVVEVEVRGERVMLGGRAITVLEGKLLV